MEELEEQMSDEEFARLESLADTPEGYCEELQYVRMTHTSRKEAVSSKEDACRKCGWSSHAFLFGELVRMHREGLTVRHLPPQPGKPWNTRFLFLDLDNKPQPGHPEPCITEAELDKVLPSLGYPDAAYTPSTSRREYRYHLFVFLGTPARTADEYVRARDEADRRIREAVAALRGVQSLPRLADPKVHWQSTLFAPFQDERREIVLEDWECSGGGMRRVPDVAHLERGLHNPKPRTASDVAEYMYRDSLVPLTSSKFCRWLRHQGLATVERIDDMEFDFRLSGVLPYVRKGASKDTSQIEEGERYTRISTFVLKLYAQARAYNLYMEEHGFESHRFTGDDIVGSFKYYVEKAYETYGDYSLDRHVDELWARIRKYESTPDRVYLETVSMYSTGKHRFRTRGYTADTAGKILDTFSNGNGSAEFESVEFRDSFLKDQRVSLPTLRKVAAARGMKVRTAGKSAGGSREGSGRKPGVSWESLASKGELVDGVFLYSGKLTGRERKFLEREGKKVKKKKIATNQK